MRSYVTARAEPGEFITPNELNDELKELVGAIHAMDHENFQAANLASSRFALGAWGNVLISESEQDIDIVHATGMRGRVFGIPFDLSGGTTIPWLVTMETGDCMLELALGAGYTDDVDELGWFVWVGIRVDGVLVARSAMQAEGTYRDHGFVVYNHPVGAGVHTIEPVYGLFRATSGTIKWMNRTLSVREVAR